MNALPPIRRDSLAERFWVPILLPCAAALDLIARFGRHRGWWR